MALTTRSGTMLVVTRGVRVRTLMRDDRGEPVSSLAILATSEAEAERSNRIVSAAIVWVFRHPHKSAHILAVTWSTETQSGALQPLSP
jgi:hypothetical protein